MPSSRSFSPRRRAQPTQPALARLVFLSLLLFPEVVAPPAAPDFSSNVVALTSKNWKEEVENSPHAVFVNGTYIAADVLV